MQFLLTLSDFIIPVTVLFIVVFGCLKRVDIYETFLEGAKEGLQTVIDILPTLIGLIMAVEVVRAGGLLTDIFANFGPDSFLGRTASVLMSCTETVFYTMSLYFLSVGVRKTRYTLPCALLANIVGVFAAVWLVAAVFGN